MRIVYGKKSFDITPEAVERANARWRELHPDHSPASPADQEEMLKLLQSEATNLMTKIKNKIASLHG